MKCQDLFSLKKKKKIRILSATKFAWHFQSFRLVQIPIDGNSVDPDETAHNLELSYQDLPVYYLPFNDFEQKKPYCQQ